MVVNLRELAEKELVRSLEGPFSLPVELRTPSGAKLNVLGQVLYDTVQFDVNTGTDKVVDEPVVVLRRSSLSVIPKAGEKWLVRIPSRPSLAAPLEDFVLDGDRAPEGGRSLGFIRLYLRKVKQS